jgi:hypothetical protein
MVILALSVWLSAATYLTASDPHEGSRLDTLTQLRESLIAASRDEEESASELLGLSVDLNVATAARLAEIPGISDHAIAVVLDLRKAHGRFQSTAFIDTLSTLSTHDRTLLRAFTTVGSPQNRRPRTRVASWSRISRRIERSRGFRGEGEERRYKGSPIRYSQRATLQSDNLRAGLTLDQPSGTQWKWDIGDRYYGFDIVRGFVSYRLSPSIETVIGDFRAEYGEGLTLWSGPSFGRSRETVRSMQRPRRGIRGSSSTLDDRILRGVAVTLRPLDFLSVDAFASRRRLDAALDTVGHADTPIVFARPVAVTAHRTELELSRRKLLGERMFGVSTSARMRNTVVGVVGYVATYSTPLAPGDRPDTFFRPGGERIVNGSLFGSTRRGSVSAFGEVTLDARSPSYVAGVSVIRTDGLEAAIAARHLSSADHRPFSSGFASRSSPMNNESGLYLGTRVPLSVSSELRAFVDLVRYPWLRYQVPRPSVASDFLVEYRYRPRPWWSFDVTWRKRSVDTRIVGPEMLVASMDRHPRHSVRLNSDVEPYSGLRIRVRAELTRASTADRTVRGHLTYQELEFQPTSRISSAVRYTHFDIDAFEARVYAYERDVAGSFSSHMFTGRGRRAYLMTTIRSSPRLAVQLRLARTWIDGTRSIGSGFDLVEGNRATDVRFQLVLRR